MPYWALYYCIIQWCSTQSTRDRDVSLPHVRLSEHTGDLSEVYESKLEELKDQIAGQLQSQFGDYEDTGTLIDKAVKVLNRRMEEKIDKMAQEKITKIEEKIDNMAQEYKGVSHRLEELIKLMAQKPTGTSASAREE